MGTARGRQRAIGLWSSTVLLVRTAGVALVATVACSGPAGRFEHVSIDDAATFDEPSGGTTDSVSFLPSETGDDDSAGGNADDCDKSLGVGALDPPTVTVTTTEQGSSVVMPDELTLHVLGAEPVEVEIWQLVETVAEKLVWRATVADPAVTQDLTLQDGKYNGTTGLKPWKGHAIRARYVVSEESCTDRGVWSTPLFFRTDDGSDYFFRYAEIHDFFVELSDASYRAIASEADPDGCVPHVRSYYEGTFSHNGTTFEGVGVRAKGGCGSGRRLSQKAGYKIHLSWDDAAVAGCPQERRLRGLKRFTFNNMVQDPSYLREVLAYRLYAAAGGTAVPRQNYARLHVNGEYVGLFLNIETFDRRFLARRFQNKDGMMYEGTYRCDIVPDNIPTSEAQWKSACLQREFKTDACDIPKPGADPTDYTMAERLVRAIDALPRGEFYPAIDSIFDFEAFLATWAVDAALNNWDSYTYNSRGANNYRVYHEPTSDRWTLIPSGLDQSSVSELRSGSSILEPYGLVARRCMQEQECAARFVAEVLRVADIMEQIDLAAFGRDIYNDYNLAEETRNDPRREISYSEHSSAVDTLLQWITTRPQELREAVQ